MSCSKRSPACQQNDIQCYLSSEIEYEEKTWEREHEKKTKEKKIDNVPNERKRKTPITAKRK